jgi:uncharacterized membrane protein YhdT
MRSSTAKRLGCKGGSTRLNCSPFVTKFHHFVQCAARCRAHLELTIVAGFVLCMYSAKETQILFQIKTLMKSDCMNYPLGYNSKVRSQN